MKAETALFRVRYESDDAKERELFLKSRDFQWNEVVHDAIFIIHANAVARFNPRRRNNFPVS